MVVDALVIGLPNLSAGFLGSIILPLVIGFLIGMLAKKLLSIALILIAIFLLLSVGSFIAPDILAPVLNIGINNLPRAIALGKTLASFIPFSSVAFIIGAILGFLKG
jgi:uncharacterized membrane protein (Fun14 family)